jgi:hypothetical protein
MTDIAIHPVPTCPHCHKRMQLNTAVSTDETQQYLCGCQGTGIIYHQNVHRGHKKN